MNPKLMTPSSFFYLVSLFLGVSISLGQVDDDSYTACSQEFQCGDNLKNIYYPFWGGNRPNFCGRPEFELKCQANNYAVIEMMKVRYRVLSINQVNWVLGIARLDLWNDTCPETFVNTTLNQTTLFNYASNSRKNLSLLYDCVSNSQTSDFPDVNKFTCPDRNDSYYMEEEQLRRYRGVANRECNGHILVPILDHALDGLRSGSSNLLAVLKAGFEVVYSDNGSDCLECMGSGGQCGHNKFSSLRPVCFCRDRPYATRCPSSGKNTILPRKSRILLMKILIGSLFAGFALVGSVFLICFFKRKVLTKNLVFENKEMKNKNVEDFLRNYGSLAPNRYRYSDVKKMTNSFKDKLGQGGFGGVYKGKLIDGCLVAVKLLNEPKGDGEEFFNEVASITRTSHINVVTLLGFCFEGSKRALIYEFMPNGSLEKLIYGEEPTNNRRLGWEKLYQIAIGIARGLEYLHRGCNTRILHFDIKPHNILLDEDFCPKISDFGLAKLCTRKESIISMLGARGTAGYIAPEVFSRNFGGVSHKSDVYSYGMMVLEMVGGRRNIDVGVDKISEIYFPHWIYKKLHLPGHLGLHGISTKDDEEIAQKMVLVGLWCIQTNPSDRPSMSKVLDMLEGSLESLQIPPKPFLSSPSRSPASSPTRSTS